MSGVTYKERIASRVLRSISDMRWEIGEMAVAFGGPEDAKQFAGLTGLSPDQVKLCREMWERFGESRKQYSCLIWQHFYVAREWGDSMVEALDWADQNEALPQEMEAWHRAQQPGADLSEA